MQKNMMLKARIESPRAWRGVGSDGVMKNDLSLVTAGRAAGQPISFPPSTGRLLSRIRNISAYQRKKPDRDATRRRSPKSRDAPHTKQDTLQREMLKLRL
jgi:hypothetical protein